MGDATRQTFDRKAIEIFGVSYNEWASAKESGEPLPRPLDDGHDESYCGGGGSFHIMAPSRRHRAPTHKEAGSSSSRIIFTG